MVKVWRQQLHFWDEADQSNDSEKESCSDLSDGLISSNSKRQNHSFSAENSDSEN